MSTHVPSRTLTGESAPGRARPASANHTGDSAEAAREVDCADGVAIHGRTVEAGHVERRGHVDRQHPGQGRGERHRLVSLDDAGRVEHHRQRLLEREHGAERPHATEPSFTHRRASLTR